MRLEFAVSRLSPETSLREDVSASLLIILTPFNVPQTKENHMSEDSNNPKSILLRAPVTMKIGPVPTDLTTSDQIMSFGLNNFARILSEKGIAADVDGQLALGTFSIDGGPAATQNTAGIRIDQRAARVQPSGDKHDLEISNDLGETYSLVGSFVNYDIARSFGDAWVEGRIEKAGA